MSLRESSMSEGPIETALFYCDNENCLVVTAFIVRRTPRCFKCGSERGATKPEDTEAYVRGLKIAMVFMDEWKSFGSGASSSCRQGT